MRAAFLLARRAARFDTAGLLVCCALSACANGIASDDDYYAGDGSFGSPGGPIGNDAEAPIADAQTSSDAGLMGEVVRLRVHQGVLNLANARICHDPDLVLDDPSTPADDSHNGPAAPVALQFNDAGSVAYGETTGYVMLPAMLSGAITVHRAPDPDAGAARDAHVPLPMDAGSSTDAARVDAEVDAGLGAADADAGLVDAGTDVDAAAGDAGGPCDLASLEAVLPLPTTSAWFAPDLAPDAGLALDRLGFVDTAGGGDTLTLFGSGLALDATELQRRSEAARQRYLAENPDDPEGDAGAAAEARHQTQSLESVYGARFLLARGVTPGNDRFALSLAHLVPDVPSVSPTRPGSDAGVGALDAGSGALHLCVTVDQKESEPGDGGVARFEFRSVAALGSQFDPNASYRFRLFAESEYQQGMSSCATTSLKPVARLDVGAGGFERNRSYTLVASGAVAPASTCTNVNATSLIRQSCALPVGELNAKIQIVPNEVPEQPQAP